MKFFVPESSVCLSIADVCAVATDALSVFFFCPLSVSLDGDGRDLDPNKPISTR